jgi:predicted transcriptional regulator
MKIFTMKREKVIETLNELPKEFELEEFMEKLVFVEKVEEGLAQIKKGKTITHIEMKEMVKKWSK